MVVLPEPVSPTIGDPAVPLDRSPTSRSTSRRPGRRTRHVLEAGGHRARAPGVRLGAGVGDVGGGVDHRDDPSPARDGVLQLVEHLGGDWTGWVKSWTRKRKASSSPRVRPRGPAGRCRRPPAAATARPATGGPERTPGPSGPGPVAGRAVLLDRARRSAAEVRASAP